MNIQEILAQPEVSIIDVREPFEFMTGHVEGAINMPLQSIPSRIEEIKNMSKPVVLYCMSGNRSGQAVHYLNQQGLDDLYNGGGIGDMEYMMTSVNIRK